MQKITRKNARIWSMLGMRRIVGMILNDLVKVDKNFMFATADVSRYFGTAEFQRQYPEHMVDVGIAEQNLVGIAAGMQKEGLHVFAATYATFITARALDQVRVNLGYMKLGVKLIGVGGGLAEGDLSATHMGIEDIADIRAIPNIIVISPADGAELIKAMFSLINFDGPAYLRLSGKTNIPIIYTQDYDFRIGKSVCLKDGKDIALIGTGTIVGTALKVAKELEARGISSRVINMHTIKPLDTEELEYLRKYRLIVSMEEHMRSGGLGSAIAEYYSDKEEKPIHQIIAVNDYYPDAGEYDRLLDACGLTEEKIIKRIIDQLKRMEKRQNGKTVSY